MTNTPFSYFEQPLDAALLLRKKNSLKQELLAAPGWRQSLLVKRIAVLGGSTTAEVVDQLEIFLLARGIQPVFYQSEYNKYYEDALFPDAQLKNFQPDLVYLHTSAMNISQFPGVSDNSDSVEQLLANQLAHFQSVWDGIAQHLHCPIIQNNFELPWQRPLGNLDGSDVRGRSRFVAQLNERFANAAAQRADLYIHDIHYLSARLGIDNWFSPRLWYLYKYALAMEMIPQLACHLSALMASVWGKSRKCLVLDLDNTLWGGVIGDDGLEGIQIGTESAEAEAYADFQRYIAQLKQRGIILAVCSKNDAVNAQSGFAHPDSVLALADFAAFKANWEPKPQNVEAVAADINIGLDSLVFVDDNPAERDIVQAQLPVVAVPDIGSDVTEFVRILDRAALFESAAITADDLQRSGQYQGNVQRAAQQAQFASYDDFLKSLDMTADIQAFNTLYMERITQLINKTNQFNLTTKRFTQTEVEQMAANDACITLYGRLQDKFGDNGLIAVVAGEIKKDELHLHLWLMSCRVLKRGMEMAMFEQLCQRARTKGVKKIIGVYLPTAKNAMVKNLYGELGFTKIKETATETAFEFDLKQALPSHYIRCTSN